MNKKINGLFILSMSISLAFMACNQGGNKESAATSDSTTITKADTVQEVAKNTVADAVTAAPNLYKLISDSLGIRILEATYKPGDSSALHSHPDYAEYVVDGGTSEFTDKDGKKTVREAKQGLEAIRPAEVHSVKNIGKTTLKVLLVEVNRPQGTVAQDPAMDATKVAPDLYKLKADTLGIRILETNYKPGQSSAMHSHPDNAIYVISGGTSEITEKGGTKHTNELKTGMAMINAGGMHSVKNIGKTTTKVLIVEVNRPGK